MLDNAQRRVKEKGLAEQFRFIQVPIQELSLTDSGYDVVLCHAVLKWVSDWQSLIRCLIDQVKPGGLLSLMFYNQHSTIYRSLVRGYLDRVLLENVKGSGLGLTPINPLIPDDVVDYLQGMGMQIRLKSGIRVFHDYMHKDVRDRRSEQDILTLEMRYSRQEPYRFLGRYYHVVAQRAMEAASLI
jgi:S-adenosylmethionine-dependent methyltransferase